MGSLRDWVGFQVGGSGIAGTSLSTVVSSSDIASGVGTLALLALVLVLEDEFVAHHEFKAAKRRSCGAFRASALVSDQGEKVWLDVADVLDRVGFHGVSDVRAVRDRGSFDSGV